MANPQPLFELMLSGAGSLNTETWLDLGVIPTGKQIFLGYMTYAAVDKNLQFETRCNLPGQSTGEAGTTVLLDWCGVTAGNSLDRDLYWGGAVSTLTTISTGVEHLWVHVTSQSNSAGTYDYIIRYTLI